MEILKLECYTLPPQPMGHPHLRQESFIIKTELQDITGLIYKRTIVIPIVDGKTPNADSIAEAINKRIKQIKLSVDKNNTIAKNNSYDIEDVKESMKKINEKI